MCSTAGNTLLNVLFQNFRYLCRISNADRQDMKETTDGTLEIPDNGYGDESIVHLEDLEHIRLRPGMYIGRLGDGTAPNDAQYKQAMEELNALYIKEEA